MSLYIYDLEAGQESTGAKENLITVTSAMVTMTASFVFCAFFVSTVLSGFTQGWAFMFFVIVRTMLIVGVMVLAASALSHIFDSAIVRRVNAAVLGMVLAFALVFFNL